MSLLGACIVFLACQHSQCPGPDTLPQTTDKAPPPWLFSVHPVIIARHRLAYLERIPVFSRLLETFPWSPCPTEESPDWRPTSLYHLRHTTPLLENGAASQTKPMMAPVCASTSAICSPGGSSLISTCGKCSHSTGPGVAPSLLLLTLSPLHSHPSVGVFSLPASPKS